MGAGEEGGMIVKIGAKRVIEVGVEDMGVGGEGLVA